MTSSRDPNEESDTPPTPQQLQAHALHTVLLATRQQIEAALAIVAAMEATAARMTRDTVQYEGPPPDAVVRVFGGIRRKQEQAADPTHAAPDEATA